MCVYSVQTTQSWPIQHYFSHYCFYYNSCSLISAIKNGENDWLLLKSFGIIALAPFFLCRDVMLFNRWFGRSHLFEVDLAFLLVKSEILVTIYLRLNALLCMSQEYFLPSAMHGNGDIMFIEICFTDYVFWLQLSCNCALC